MIKITKKMLTNRPYTKLTHLKYFVIHSTANPNVGCDNHYTYFNREGIGTHLIVDDKKCYHMIPYSELAYHVGRYGNPYSIGIEICEMDNNFEAVWKNSIDVVRQVVKQLGLSKNQVISHNWVSRNLGGTDHTDPIGFFERHGKTFNQFVDEVFKKEEVKYLMEEMVCYCNDIDKHGALMLAEFLGCPCMDARQNFQYDGVAKNLIAVGGGNNFSGYTTLHLKGSDRWDTLKKVIEYAKTR